MRTRTIVAVGVLMIVAALAVSDQSVRGSASGVVISEFRVRGPYGSSDEFVELYNASSSAVAIGGWKLKGSDTAGTVIVRATIPAGIVLNPGCHYLLYNETGIGGPYSGAVRGDQPFGYWYPDDSGIALTLANDAIVDQVGMSAGTRYKEGAPLASLGSLSASNVNRGYERKPGGAAGSGTDTDNNASDFQVRAPSDPQNLASPCVVANPPTSPAGAGSASPASVHAGDATLLTVTVTPGTNPASTGIAVTANLAAIGGSSSQALYDDGSNGDETAGDNRFSFQASIAPLSPIGPASLPVTVGDAEGRSTTTAIALTVLQAPTPIHAIQGQGPLSPLIGLTVTTRGVVTAWRPNDGFFLQAPDAVIDADATTSEGIFVRTGGAAFPVASPGAYVQVTGSVQEIIPADDPDSPPTTQLAGPLSVSLPGQSHAMPLAVELTPADLSPLGDLAKVERLEGMRVHVALLRVTGPTGGAIDEPQAAAQSNGIFFGVIDGEARPLREAGIHVLDPLPPGSPAGVPRFDGNPERLRVDSAAQPGATPLDVTAGALVSNLTGVVDFGGRTWTLLPDPSSPPAVSAPATATPVPDPGDQEFTIGSVNLGRLFDTADDPATDDAVLTAAAFQGRLAKASLAIRTMMKAPDIVGVQGVENLQALQALAARLNTDSAAASLPDPGYAAWLVDGNDASGLDVGVLVRTSRVTVGDVSQQGASAAYVDPASGLAAGLFDQPPLLLTAQVHGPIGTMPVTVVVCQLQPRAGAGGAATSAGHRAKRQAQAEFLARLIQARQAASPTERIVALGGFEASALHDGEVDVMGTVAGTPAPSSSVVLASPDLVNPDLVDLATLLSPIERYSSVEAGSALAFDHILVNGPARSRTGRFHYARSNADFPESYREDAGRPERLSDRDMPVAYFSFPGAPVLQLNGANPLPVECCGVFTDPGAMAIDADFADLTSSIATSGSVDMHSTGSYTLTYSVSNGYATTTVTRTVNVVDSTAPALTLRGGNPMTVEVGGTFADPGASASDACAGDLGAKILVSGAVRMKRPWTYLLTYTVSDGVNTTSMTRTVNVVDTTPPALSAIRPSVSVLWPVTNRLVVVRLAYTHSDNSGADRCSVGVQSNEPERRGKDGPEWLVVDTHTLLLRAARDAHGAGRAYVVTVTCRDRSGNASTGSAAVTVPARPGADVRWWPWRVPLRQPALHPTASGR